MMRRSLPAVFLVLLVSMLSMGGIPVQASGAQTYHLSKTFTDTDPCTGEVVTGELDAVFVVNGVWTGNGRLHAIIQASAHGELTGGDGSIYRFSFEGIEQFDAVADYFDVPLHGEAISEGSAPNFSVDGFARIFTDGSPAEAIFTPSCG